MGSVVIPHLVSGWHVDQAILSEEERLVVIRFGRDWDPDCMRQDEVLYKIADKVKSFAVVYVCDIDQVPDFNSMYGTCALSLSLSLSLSSEFAATKLTGQRDAELYDPCTIMFFFRIDIIETIYRGAKKGRGLVVSPKGTHPNLIFSLPKAVVLAISRPWTDSWQTTPRDTDTRRPVSRCSLLRLRPPIPAAARLIQRTVQA